MKIKNLIKSLFIFAFSMFVFVSYTSANEYKYTNLDVNAVVLNDGTIKVKETFTADFLVKKHGIFRTIPLNYSVDGNKFHINVSNINVEGKKFTTKRSRAEWTIKIGDPNIYEYGKVVYPISYTVYGLIKNFSGMGYSELYWNIVGNKFDTSIENVTAVINLPKVYTGFDSSDFLITADGITRTVEQFQGTVDWSHGDKIIITYDKGLSAYHGITLAVKFPNNYFEFDDKKQAKLLGDARITFAGILGSIKAFFSDINENLGMLMYIFMFPVVLVVLIVSTIQKKREKTAYLKRYGLKGDFAEKYKVIVQYTPPKGLNSAEVGLLFHRKENINDLFSLVYKWAAEGLIQINADISEKTFGIIKTGSIKIEKIKEIPESAPDFEKKFFNRFIDKKETDLLHYDQEHFVDLNRLRRHGITMGWLKDKSNEKLTPTVIIIIIVLFALSFFIKPLFILFSIILILVFGNDGRLKETDKGAQLISHILGYKQFLVACDEKQLRTFLKQDPLYFDKTLPYAVALGLETEFLKKITPIMEEYNIPVKWYNGDFRYFNRMLLRTNSVGMQSVYTKSSGFSGGSSFGGGGGGFSGGGGGGGGGGGSW